MTADCPRGAPADRGCPNNFFTIALLCGSWASIRAEITVRVVHLPNALATLMLLHPSTRVQIDIRKLSG